MAKGDTMSQRQMQDLNPGPLTSQPEFLRNGCLAMCFPFALSSQTVSAALGTREETWSRGPEVGGPPSLYHRVSLQQHYWHLNQIILLWRTSCVEPSDHFSDGNRAMGLPLKVIELEKGREKAV